MTSAPPQPATRVGPASWRTVVREAVLVAASGFIFALLANHVSPAGLKLSRDYFPKALPAAAPAAATVTSTNVTPEARLRAEGLGVITTDEARRRFESPDYIVEKVIFVDARDDERYQAGHVPGAYQFDHYHPERQMATVLPACLAATTVVVYCEGGECEDSEFAARTLASASVPREKLQVYTGGFTNWQTARLPIEIGVRHSGQRLPTPP